MSASDKMKNETQKAAGKAEEVAGRATDDRSLEAEGRGDQAQADLEQAAEKAKDAVPTDPGAPPAGRAGRDAAVGATVPAMRPGPAPRRPFDLTGHVALVTGAGSAAGIGFACARALGLLGARVAVASTTDRIQDRRRQLAAEGIEAWAGVADLTDEAEAVRLVAEAREAVGPADIVVNNAGMTSVSAPAVEAALGTLGRRDWHEAIERNLSSAFHVSSAAVGV